MEYCILLKKRYYLPAKELKLYLNLTLYSKSTSTATKNILINDGECKPKQLVNKTTIHKCKNFSGLELSNLHYKKEKECGCITW